jgi:hypothetical protein
MDLTEMEIIKKENERLKKENDNNINVIKKLMKELQNLKRSSEK